MAYGTAIAVATQHLDLILCVKCATYAYTHAQEKRSNDFFFWLRDVKSEEIEVDAQESKDFLKLFNSKNGVPDIYSIDVDARLMLLLEGQHQDLINGEYCTNCLVPLESLCTDY